MRRGFGGSTARTRAARIDFNAFVASGAAGGQLVAGATVHGQFWFRDPPEPILHSGLSIGIQFTLCP